MFREYFYIKFYLPYTNNVIDKIVNILSKKEIVASFKALVNIDSIWNQLKTNWPPTTKKCVWKILGAKFIRWAIFSWFLEQQKKVHLRRKPFL